MTTLQIIFFGLICFFGSGQDPRMVIVFDLSRGENVHGHKVQSHAAFIRVRCDDINEQKTNWPFRKTPKGCELELDKRTLEISGINDDKLQVDDDHRDLVPHIERECPALGEKKDDKELKAAAAANIELTYGKLCAHKAEGGVVSSVYKVATNGETTITGKRTDYADRVLVLEPNAIIEIRNDPVGPLGDDNHFIAYYRQIAKNDACCTNLPYRKVPKGVDGCRIPAEREPSVSTVACSNSNYP